MALRFNIHPRNEATPSTYSIYKLCFPNWYSPSALLLWEATDLRFGTNAAALGHPELRRFEPAEHIS